MKQWQPDSWQNHLSHNTPIYYDELSYRTTLEQIQNLPPLVSLAKMQRLQSLLADAAAGNCFLLQGGDCAERFGDCHAASIQARMKTLLHGSLVLASTMHKPIVRVGRIAGQYAKPRNSMTETRHGVSLPSYMGDLTNRPFFSP